MKVLKTGNGRLAVNSKRAESLLEKLIEEDRVWSYLSIIFNNYIETHDSISEPPKTYDSATMQEMKTMLEEVMKKVDKIETNIPTGAINNTTQQRVEPKEAESKSDVPRKARPKKKSPPKTGGLNLAAMASRFKKSDR